jgi:carbonic anhydrase
VPESHAKPAAEVEPSTRGSAPTFATALCCIDGRVQGPLADFVRTRFGVDYVDTVTRAGLVGRLDSGVEADLTISIEAHQSQGIVVSGHAGCAGYSGEESAQREACRAAAARLGELWGEMEIVPVWVALSGAVEPL